MSTTPEDFPLPGEASTESAPVEHQAADQQTVWTSAPVNSQDPLLTTAVDAPSESGIFAAFSSPEPIPAARIPNFGHLLLLGFLFALGWLGAGSILLVLLHFHAFGISTLSQATQDFRYTVGSQAVQYFIVLAASLTVFPPLWQQSFFRGIHWHWAQAFLYRGRLISAVFLCFVGAIANMTLMPGPDNTPIDQLFKAPGAAWVLFAFGVTLAPFFEELVFRGFLLPALCTAYDWVAERMQGASRRPLDEDGNPQWSLPAMVAGAVITSLPFALMHGEQTGWSLGPFSLLICVSIVLCWIRLSTRSLAASVVVHAGYNFALFSLMLLGTGGFKHLEKM
jgi:uncharacterized protein